MRTHQATSLVILVLLLACNPVGCMTIRNGSTQILHVETEPAGALVRFNPGGATVESPEDVILGRRHAYVVVATKDGYQKASVILESKLTSEFWWRNLVWIHPYGWIIGWIVDGATSAGRELRPTTVSLTLLKSEAELAEPSTPSAQD